MREIETYEIVVKSVDVDEHADGSGEVTVVYRGKAEEKTAKAAFKTGAFRDLFDCCEAISQNIMMSEFRPNTGVHFSFDLVNDEGISVWHTTPNNYLKMPLKMNIDWTCQHLSTSYKSYTTLGVVRIPDTLKLVDGRLPAQKLAELLIQSMVSGLEFIGLMFMQREQMGRDHHA